MSDEETQVVDSAETTTSNDDSYEQDDSTGETETASSTEGSEQSSGETPDQRLARLKRQYERELKKQGKEGSKETSKEGSEKGSSLDEKYLILDLKTEGVRDTKEQKVVLEYIRESKLIGKDVDVATALKSPVVREDIEAIRKQSTVPTPSGRTGNGSSNSMEYYVAQIKRGSMSLKDVPSAEMRKRIRTTRGLF